MSSPDVQPASESGQSKKRDRPPALQIPPSSNVPDEKVHYGRVSANGSEASQEPPDLFLATEERVMESETSVSRSASATSSLDPYYFGHQSPTDSPAPPFLAATHSNVTPELYPINDPVTPAKDPSTIDRRGLVGVGELSTPRWAKIEKANGQDSRDDGDDYELVLAEDTEKDGPDSPWTIEAIDGEWGDEDEHTEFKPTLRSLRSRPSVTEESGGEEILYPRKSAAPGRSRHLNPSDGEEEYDPTIFPVVEIPTGESSIKSPPSSFDTPPRKARKRTSDEFEIDHTRTLVSRRLGSSSGSLKAKGRDERAAVSKHRSLTSGNFPSVSREKNRRESAVLSITGGTKAAPCAGKLSDRHSRQTSGSSSSSNHGDGSHNRRMHAADFSHLPPSPSSSSIQHFLKQTGAVNNANTPPLQSSSKEPQALPSPNVAHSLLRGTQEGWSCLDDEATAEALRKLDGLTGKTARARASVGSFGRPASLSRPGTPPGKNGGQWEGMGLAEGVCNSDDQRTPSIVEKTPKRSSNPRASFTPKRISASSTYAGTPTATTSPRDSTPLSATTSLISMSATTRHSMAKAKRNSAGSDVSSVHSSDATSLKDRVASLALAGDALEDEPVPPVPPLPKDLSTYRSPPASSASHVFPSLSTTEDKLGSRESDEDLAVPSDGPPLMRPLSNLMSPSSHGHSQKDRHNAVVIGSQPEPAPTITKTPSRKWSFSALNIKLSSSPSSSSKSSVFPLSPRSVSFGPQLRKSASKDRARSPSGASTNTWPAVQQDAMSSVASLASVSSNGSAHRSKSPPSLTNLKTPERGPRSRSGTDSSASTSHTTSAPTRQLAPISPTSSVRRGHSSKRLTPSSIPFFRRSSSQSIQLPPTTMAASSSPTPPSGPTQPPKNDKTLPVPGSARKKSSVLSLGLPSLLKGSSSRRSLHAEKSDPTKDVRDSQKAEGAERENEKGDRDKSKKEDKDRSESRISVLMGRKRGKTLSSADPKKLKPQNLPPMQISALPSATAQRVASLKAASLVSTPTVVQSTTRPTSSRVTSQTMSSMQKQSDSSLRGRNQLPTIAGSPSVGTNSSQPLKDPAKDHPPSLLNTVGSMSKETPTKIPRISSRTSAISTPPPKNSVPISARAGANAAGQSIPSVEPSPTPSGLPINEFGVMENGDTHVSRGALHSTSQRQGSAQVSPSAGSRVPRQVTAASSSSGGFLHRKGNRDSASFTGLRKASTSSVTSTVSVPPNESHRFSALSPSKGLKLLSPKVNISSGRVASSSTSQNIYQAIASPASSRHSLSSPSPVPSGVDEEELLGDEEMMHYIRRQQAKKMASGATQAELDDLLRFPEPLGPGSPSSPAAILKSNQAQNLSEYERKEILDYPSIYCIGTSSKKKLATLDNSSSNYGYDDERGDYLVVNHDHLAYRYEIIDTLGKGSFGQVLHCRDHCSGESVAIKIIRNKKRFHHQALVEIKILDNLRKWDSEERHHVIKMTEHFYFRNHLCIAMELLSINLYELIKANGFVGFTTTLIRRFTSQMLLSLSLMRHHRIVHCDLKPENVLLRHPAKSALKVIDFGSSCFEHEKIYTYIQSRFYRSPEVILGMNYHMAIDMWSLGCILAELYTGFPIFPGENEQEQLSCIMEVLGIPDKDFVNRSSRKRLFFDSNGAPRAVVNSKGRRRRPGTKTLAQVLRCNDEEFVDFISRCLVWDPERRIKPQAAMRHPFITASRRSKPSNPPSGMAKSLLSSSTGSGSRSKPLVETPKKSQISAPTPLTARSSRTATNTVPSTPSSSSIHAITLGSSSRSYRSTQAQAMSSYHSSRTLSGFAASAK